MRAQIPSRFGPRPGPGPQAPLVSQAGTSAAPWPGSLAGSETSTQPSGFGMHRASGRANVSPNMSADVFSDVRPAAASAWPEGSGEEGPKEEGFGEEGSLQHKPFVRRSLHTHRPGLLRHAFRSVVQHPAGPDLQRAEAARAEELEGVVPDPAAVVTDAGGIPWPAALMRVKRLQEKRQQECGGASAAGWHVRGALVFSGQGERLAVCRDPEDALFCAQLNNVLPLVLAVYERLAASYMEGCRDGKERSSKLEAVMADWNCMQRVLAAQNALVRTYNDACLHFFAREQAGSESRGQVRDTTLLDWLVSHMVCENARPVCPYACGHFDQTGPCPLWKPANPNEARAVTGRAADMGEAPKVDAWKKLVFAADGSVLCRCNTWQCWKQACLWACGRSVSSVSTVSMPTAGEESEARARAAAKTCKDMPGTVSAPEEDSKGQAPREADLKNLQEEAWAEAFGEEANSADTFSAGAAFEDPAHEDLYGEVVTAGTATAVAAAPDEYAGGLNGEEAGQADGLGGRLEEAGAQELVTGGEPAGEEPAGDVPPDCEDTSLGAASLPDTSFSDTPFPAASGPDTVSSDTALAGTATAVMGFLPGDTSFTRPCSGA